MHCGVHGVLMAGTRSRRADVALPSATTSAPSHVIETRHISIYDRIR